MNAKHGLASFLIIVGCGGDDDTALVSPVERGKYIVDTVAVCQDCHTPRDEMGAPIAALYLAGAECFVRLDNGSCLNSRNLTNDATGLLNRTDEEIERMIRDGVRPAATGDEPLSPVMPYYSFHNMTDDDLDAVIAYLRTVPGVSRAIPRSGPEFELAVAVNPLDPSRIPMPMSEYADREAALRGRYLAAQAGVCLECHTRHVMGQMDVLDLGAIFAGGEPFPIGLPMVPVSSNLTSDADTGLGGWSVEDIVEVLANGTDPDGERLCPPMPAGPMGPYANLKPEDALDIAHYIKSLPPISNAVQDVCSAPPL